MEPPDWRALGLRDGSARAYYELGRALHRSSRPSEQDAAIRALELAHELQPLAAAYTELGIVLRARGRMMEAVSALRKAVAFTPREPAAYLHLSALVPPREAASLAHTAIELQPSSSSAYFALAMALRQSGDLAAAQSATEVAAAIAPSDARLAADWRHWRVNRDRAMQESGGTNGIGYEANLQFPWRGVELREMAATQLAAAHERLPPLPTPLSTNWPRPARWPPFSERARQPGSSALPQQQQRRRQWRRPSAANRPDAGTLGSPLRVAYVGSLSDEPQMRAMATLFAMADTHLATFAVHPVTAAPTPHPDYLRAFLDSMPHGTLRGQASSAAALAHAIAGDAPHILLDGLWRKECLNDGGEGGEGGESGEGGEGGEGGAGDHLPSINSSAWPAHKARGTTDGRRLACALLLKPAPLIFSVLAAPTTAGGAHAHYTLGDPVCLPPRLAKAFSERFVLLQAGAYPFNHAHWAPHARPADASATGGEAGRSVMRASEGLRSSSFVLASFVQRWKLNPITWDVWVNVLRRGPPASMLWLLQHPLDGTRQALSRMLRTNELSELSPKRMQVMRRRPLLEHLTRVGLADLTIDTWPYTAHTTAADALWAGGAPWLALGASEDRMDSLLSSAVLASAGALPLVAGTLRSFEDAAVAMMVDAQRRTFRPSRT